MKSNIGHVNKKTFDPVIAFLVVIVMSICIASTMRGLSPIDFSSNIWAIVGLASLIGSFVAFLRSITTGIISGVLYAMLLSTLFEVTTPYSVFSLCAGIVLGVILHSHPVIALLISVGYIFTVVLTSTVQNTILFTLAGGTSFLVHEYSDIIVDWLNTPLSQLRTYARPLIAFIFVYAAIVLVFALLFQTSFNINPMGSFKFGDSWKDDISFLTFLYLSIAALKSSPPAGITPVNELAKLLVAFESVVGIFILVVFIKFVLTDVKESVNHQIPKENGYGNQRKESK